MAEEARDAAQRRPAKTFRDLEVWEEAHRFVLGVYRITERFPKAELFGLTSQWRRAAVSVPANIAEGFRRRGQADKAHFMNVADGSLEECRCYLILAQDLEYAETDALARQLDCVSHLLTAYEAALRRHAPRAQTG